MLMVNNKISIITVCYNAKEALERTISSIKLQSFKNFEYIIIDGGSQDGTLEVINRNLRLISKWISEPDKGIYDAMNKGIKLASSDWLIFMNAGDIFASNNVLEKINNNLVNEYKIVYGNIIKVYNKHKEHICGLNKRQLDAVDFVLHTIDHQSAFIHQSLFSLYGLYDTSYKLASDWKFFFQTAGIRKVPTKYVDLDIAIFMMDGASTLGQDKYKKEENEILKKEFGVYYSFMIELANYRKSSLIRNLYRIRMFLKERGLGKFKKIFRIKF